MNSSQFESLVNEQFKFCYNLLFEKAKQYSIGTADRLHAFKVAAEFQGITSEQALLGMLSKHLVSISDMIKNNTEHNEDVWNEKISDSINYLLLLKAIVVESQQNEEDEAK